MDALDDAALFASPRLLHLHTLSALSTLRNRNKLLAGNQVYRRIEEKKAILFSRASWRFRHSAHFSPAELTLLASAFAVLCALPSRSVLNCCHRDQSRRIISIFLLSMIDSSTLYLALEEFVRKRDVEQIVLDYALFLIISLVP